MAIEHHSVVKSYSMTYYLNLFKNGLLNLYLKDNVMLNEIIIIIITIIIMIEIAKVLQSIRI